MRLGEHKFNQTKDCFTNTIMNRTECADPTVDINVEQIIIHPRYSNTDSQMMNDIALIRLANKIHFTGMIILILVHGTIAIEYCHHSEISTVLRYRY